MKKNILVLALLIFSAMMLLGCQTLWKKESSPKGPTILEPSIMTRFNDIPIPSGFKLLPKESYSFENAGVRMGVLRYQGKASAEQVVNFFKEQMPMYNWRLLNVIEYNQRLMNFDRDDETCNVNLATRLNSVIITISLGPKPPMPKKADKPVK